MSRRSFAVFLILLLPAVSLHAQDELAPEIKALEAAFTSEEAAYEAIDNLAQAYKTKIAENEDKIEDAKQANNAAVVNELNADVRERYEFLRKLYEFSLDRYPDNARLQNYYGEVLYDGFGEQAGALKAWYRAIALDDEYPNAFNNLGMHLFHNGEYRQGLEFMDRALEIDSKNPDFLFNMTQFYLMHGPQVSELRGWPKPKVYKEAMKMSKKAAKESPDDFEILQDYAVNFWKAAEFEVEADWKESAKAWREARAKATKQEQIFFAMLNEARAWLQAEKYKEAAESAQEALTLMPDSRAAQTVLDRAQAGGKE